MEKRSVKMIKNFNGERSDFFIGVNYWASHAGTNMWKNFNAKVVEDDFLKMENAGIKVARVFPLWSDFQPITAQIGPVGITREVAFGDKIRDPSDAAENAGVDIRQIKNFKTLLAAAKRHGIKLIVPLITGFT